MLPFRLTVRGGKPSREVLPSVALAHLYLIPLKQAHIVEIELFKYTNCSKSRRIAKLPVLIHFQIAFSFCLGEPRNGYLIRSTTSI